VITHRSAKHCTGDLRGSASEQQMNYEALLQQTAREVVIRHGGTPAKHLAVWRARVSAKPHRDLTEEAQEEARQRFYRRHSTVESGDALSADNDWIDMDLVCEYAGDHQDTS